MDMYDTSVYSETKADRVSSWTHLVHTGISLVGFFLEDSTMKRIPLTQGKFAIVDDDIYKFLSGWKWFAIKDRNTWYGMRRDSNKHVSMHRIILGLKQGDGLCTDHANHNGLDNRRFNLRICNHAGNSQNQLPHKNCASRYKGVGRIEKRWQSRIGYNDKRIYLGTYDTEWEAAEAYDKKAKELFGEFAQLNFPEGD